MKAIVWTQYGPADVLKLKEVAKPTPGDSELLIKIYATTVTMGDCEIRSFKVPRFLWLPMRLWLGVTKPRKEILGQEFAGEVEFAGKDVKRFRKGDQVFAQTGMTLGAYAEYICMPEETGEEEGVIAHKPSNMSYEEAAAVPVGGLVASRYIKQAKLQPGQTILINGAGGSIGTFAVQLAKLSGAVVTAIDAPQKLDMLRSIGADHVIDYTSENFIKSGKTYDVVFDIVGNLSYADGLSLVKPNGHYLLGNSGLSHIIRGLWESRFGSKTVYFGVGANTIDELTYLKDLIEEGKLKAIIDRRYPLEQMPEAHRYVENGLKAGNVVITLPHHQTSVDTQP